MISNYIVEKREAKEGEQWQLVSSSVSGATCRVPNLIENAGYYFRVSAQNQYGVSEALEIPSVVIIKSPFGKFRSIVCHFWLLQLQCSSINSYVEHDDNILCLFLRKTGHATAALHHQLHQGLLCRLLEASKQ